MLAKHRYITAFLVAIIVHIILTIPLFFLTKKNDLAQPQRKVLNLSQFEATKPEPKVQPQPKITKQTEKKPPVKQITKHTPLQSQIAKPKELNITQSSKPIKIEQPQPVVQKQIETKQSTTLSALNEVFKSNKPTETKGPIKQLYGDEFERMSEPQKQFIRDNLGSIGKITEKHLRYPEAAGRLSMQGRSVVEFLLHPNGDISDLKLLDSSGYRALDKNSIETIEVAYKDYPRPSQTTKIRIYVHYQLY